LFREGVTIRFDGDRGIENERRIGAMGHLVIFAVRRILRSPRELPAIVLTLSIGVGAVAAGFAVLRAVLLAPLPYRDPGRLVRVWDAAGYPGLRTLSARQFETVKTAPFLEGAAAYAGIEQNLRAISDS
jgi:hypothetical protein